MPGALQLKLTAEQRQELEHLRDHDRKPHMRERAAALLKIADGMSGLAVSQRGLLRYRKQETIYDWVRRYQEEGLAGLAIRPGRGRKPAFPPRHPDAESARDELQHVVGRDPGQYGHTAARWNLQRLLDTCNWLTCHSLVGVHRLLRRLKLHYKRGRQYIHSPDPDYQAKLDLVCECLKRARLEPDRYAVLFEDELTYYRQPSLASGYAPAGPEQPLARLSYNSNSSRRVIATLNALTGQVLYKQASRTNLSMVVDFYEAVCERYADREVIWIVQDNWPIHFHPDVLVALQPQTSPFPFRQPRTWRDTPRRKARRLNLPIQLLTLPTYSPWTNPIEKLWRWLKQEVLHLHRLASDWLTLQHQVGSFLDRFQAGSSKLLQYVGLCGEQNLYSKALGTSQILPY